MIKKQKFKNNFKSVSHLAADCQGHWGLILTLTPSVIPNSNYVITVSD
jgi:hypothetical protein